MDLEGIKNEALEAIQKAESHEAINDVKVRYLGRKQGVITDILRSLKTRSIKERKAIGPKANALRKEIETALRERLESLSGASASIIDVTRPGTRIEHGHLHPLTLVDREIRSIFNSLNFSVVEGPEVESEYYNFDALNIPAGHPARDMWDTFWLKGKRASDPKKNYLLRTHTSPMQVRFMERHQPPFQIIVPGRVFRHEATDATHEFNFHQVEGLMVGREVSLANFKYIIEQFMSRFFRRKIEVRFRPSYFPFTEPSVEVDIKWRNTWLEMMGAGMVNPKVFKAAGYNPQNWQGFAFGFGLERFAMIKYKVSDIRWFHSGDLRFIRQF